MANTIFRSMFNSLSIYKTTASNWKSIHTSTVSYAARKGTRAKARAKKVKVEVTKVGFVPHNLRGKNKIVKSNVNKHMDDSFKKVAPDDVYPMRYFRWPVYTAEEAVRCHAETHHPTMFNVPDALVHAYIELNMEAVKKTRTLDVFSRLTLLPHWFPREDERTILAFCKGQELINKVIDAGATKVGGVELVKKIQDGEIRLGEFDYVIAHPNILTDLVPIRGLMKKKFPNLKSGTLDNDLPGLVKKFAKGVQFRSVKDEHQQNFGFVNVPVGRLNMDPKEVAENIEALIKDLQSFRPKRDGLFITRCLITSPPATEKLKIDPFVYVERTLSKEEKDDSDDEEEMIAAAKA